MEFKKALKFGAIGLFVIVGSCTTMNSCTTVDPGHRGVAVSLGKVDPSPLPEGLHFVNPFTTDVIKMDTRVQKWGGKTATYTKDLQQGLIVFTVNYRLDPTQTTKMYQTVGENWFNQIAVPKILEGIKNELGRWNAPAVIGNRNTVAQNIENSIRTDLAKRGVIIDSLEIVDIKYSEAFEAAVEAKEVETQKAIQAKNRTVRIEEETKQALIRAEGESKSMKIRAQALAENPKLVEYEAVRVQAAAVQKWNGVLPVYTGNGPVPFIEVK